MATKAQLAHTLRFTQTLTGEKVLAVSTLTRKTVNELEDMVRSAVGRDDIDVVDVASMVLFDPEVADILYSYYRQVNDVASELKEGTGIAIDEVVDTAEELLAFVNRYWGNNRFSVAIRNAIKFLSDNRGGIMTIVAIVLVIITGIAAFFMVS